MRNDKLHFVILLGFIVFCLFYFTGCGGKGSYSIRGDLVKINSYLSNEIPGLNDMNDFEKSVEIRNFLYQKTLLDNTQINWNNLWFVFEKSVVNPKIGHICGGYSLLYMAALASFDIPVRHVQIFDSVGLGYDGHSTTEIFINGKWVVSDMTFNVMYVDEFGNYLSYEDLKTVPHYPTANGFSVKPGRNLDDYYVEIEELINFIVMNESIISPSRLIPETWDGKVNQNGQILQLGSVKGTIRGDIIGVYQ